MSRPSDRDVYDILPLMRDLCSFSTNVVADDNECLFARLRQELPFRRLGYPTGQTHNGWIVPSNWRVKKAQILQNGKVLFDGTTHPLGVGTNSVSFVGELTYEELRSHLVTNPDLPDAYMFHSIWQIRSWESDWVLCVPYQIYKTIGPGYYNIELVTEFEPGEMLVMEFEHCGRSDETIVFNTNTCHRTQANDGFAAVALLTRLFQQLSQQDTYYTYRLVLGPEHLGSVFYMRDQSRADIERMVSCVFAEMPGNLADLCATETFLGDQILDRAFSNILRHHSNGYRLVPWRQGAGNDETVWEAPGHEIPTVELTRSQYPNYPYREYHSSCDNPDLMDPKMMNEFYDILFRVVEVLEQDAVAYRHFEGLVCLSNPQYNLYFEREDPTIAKDLSDEDEKWGHLLDSLLRYFDGSMSILDIAEKHELSFDALRRYLLKLQDCGLITLQHRPIARPALSQMRG